ncbi:MAG: hypothetical protein KIT72_18240 [Polyangiaceae bacterium]|nr:hypothetical protein [Polyangiaceae bacterium]MCW5792357.1 hypothetical protein [Polyangiaceae bacterium]
MPLSTTLIAALLSVVACSSDSSKGSIGGPDAGGDASPPQDSGADADAAPVEGCGDEVRDTDEDCDGSDFGGATCATEVAEGWVGSLACSPTCTLITSGCTTPVTTYAPLEAAGFSVFELGALGPEVIGYRGAGFDGRHVYFVPHTRDENHGLVLRYDTGASFDAAEAWSTFDVATLDPAAVGFQNAAFDGTYLYLIPARGSEPRGTITRYDTRAPFDQASSWQAFDLEGVHEDAKGFSGASFDGRYLYLSPRNNGSSHGRVLRFDTRADLIATSSWSTFDLTTVNPDARGFEGTSFDGRYVYFAPYFHGAYHGLVARFDTQADFSAASSWSTFDLTSVHADARGYQGTAFDGRYLYFAPHRHEARHGRIARFDTQADFSAVSAWSTFDVSTLDAEATGYQGAAFDGRHVYLIPFYNGTAYHGRLARFDTLGALDDAASWSVFDVSTVAPHGVGFFGAVFDGSHLYLGPSLTSEVIRFEAKSPAWLPARWNASFF